MKKKFTLKQKISWSLIYLILILLAISFLYPLFFTFVNALKTQTEYMTDPFSIDLIHGHFEHFDLIFSNFKIGTYLKNTLIATMLRLCFSFPPAICASYAIAKLRFKGKSVVYPIILIAMFIPFQVIMIPVYVMLTKAHLINTFIGLTIVTGTLTIPGIVMLLTANFRGITNEMLEAATIDGCGYFGIIKNIIIPIGKPALSICFIMNFITAWNDLLAPMVVMKSVEKRLVIPALNSLVSLYKSNIPFQLTGLLIASMPAVLIYVIFQEKIIMGISTGSIK